MDSTTDMHTQKYLQKDFFLSKYSPSRWSDENPKLHQIASTT